MRKESPIYQNGLKSVLILCVSLHCISAIAANVPAIADSSSVLRLPSIEMNLLVFVIFCNYVMIATRTFYVQCDQHFHKIKNKMPCEVLPIYIRSVKSGFSRAGRQ